MAGDRQLPGGHLVEREGARLVRADHRCRTQRLHGREALDDGVAAGDLPGADGQQGGDHGGEPGGDGGHGQRHTGDEQLVEVVAADQADHHHQGERQPGDAGDDLREAVELLLERRLLGLGPGEQVGDVADLGVHAGAGDDDLASAPGDRRVHVRHAGAVAEGDVFPGNRFDALADGQALPGEGRFLDLEGRRQGDPAVGGHHVPRLHQHQVAGDELLGVDLDHLAIPSHPGDGLHHVGERLDTLFGLRLLAEADDRVDQGQPGEQDGGARLPGDHLVDDGGREEDDLHEVLVLADERLEPGLALRRRQLVGPVLGEATLHLGGTQAVFEIGPDRGGDRGAVGAVPIGLRLLDTGRHRPRLPGAEIIRGARLPDRDDVVHASRHPSAAAEL